MQGKRLDRVGHLIQMELGQLILHRSKDPRIGFVTITHVDVAPDIRSARVYYSVMGNEKARRDCQRALEKAAGFFQREISNTIELRYTPKLTFILDETLQRGMEIDQILRNIEGEKNAGSS